MKGTFFHCTSRPRQIQFFYTIAFSRRISTNTQTFFLHPEEVLYYLISSEIILFFCTHYSNRWKIDEQIFLVFLFLLWSTSIGRGSSFFSVNLVLQMCLGSLGLQTCSAGRPPVKPIQSFRELGQAIQVNCCSPPLPPKSRLRDSMLSNFHCIDSFLSKLCNLFCEN